MTTWDVEGDNVAQLALEVEFSKGRMGIVVVELRDGHALDDGRVLVGTGNLRFLAVPHCSPSSPLSARPTRDRDLL